jgi:release factor glutamine methyltransferase
MLADVTDIPRVLREAEAYLVERGVPNARRNAEWLLGHVLGCRSPELYLNPYRVIDRADLEAFYALVSRRGEREPLQYILGTTEFMSLPFRTRPGVFIPRPDTEALVETVEAWLRSRESRSRSRERRSIGVLDLCCGAGVIGVSLVCRHPDLDCTAVDVNVEAVALARENAALSGVGERFRCVAADAFDFVRESPRAYDVVVCNPPYVPTGDMEKLLPELRDHEPASGLDGGADGLRYYRDLIPLLPRVSAPGGIVAFEIGDTQAAAVTSLFESIRFADVAVHRDYAGADRVVTARRPPDRA